MTTVSTRKKRRFVSRMRGRLRREDQMIERTVILHRVVCSLAADHAGAVLNKDSFVDPAIVETKGSDSLEPGPKEENVLSASRTATP